MLFLLLALHADPTFTDLFEAGKGGYALYRIPALVVTPKGTLLAACEARKHAKSDWGHIDLLVGRAGQARAAGEEVRAQPGGREAEARTDATPADARREGEALSPDTEFRG